jgi:polyhydroxyalkanoate synthesis regulator phasin
MEFLTNLLKNSKARVLAIFVLVLLLVVLTIVFIHHGTGITETNKPAKVPSISDNIQSTPGSRKLSKSYLDTLLKSNQATAQQALQTGGSAIPTLINTQNGAAEAGDLLTAGSGGCSALCDKVQSCCGQEGGPSSGALIDQMLGDASVTADVATELQEAGARGASMDDYANKLNQMVKDGKITPEQAKQLLAAYARQQRKLTADQMVDQMALPPDSAKSLHDLSAKGASVDEYSAKLNELVKQGKLTPEQASQLLKTYQAHHQQMTPQGLVDQMIAGGEVSPEVGYQLRDIAKKATSPEDYARQINQLVKEGKLTPEQAKQLLSNYRLNQTQKKPLSATDLTAEMVASGQISPEAGERLNSLAREHVSAKDYAAELQKLVKEGKLTKEQAAQLLSTYQKEHPIDKNQLSGDLIDQLVMDGVVTPDVGEILNRLEASDLSASDFAQKLDQLVREGKISPELAKRLLEAYLHDKRIEAQAAKRAATIPLSGATGKEATSEEAAADNAKLQTAFRQQAQELVGTWGSVNGQQLVISSKSKASSQGAAAAEAEAKEKASDSKKKSEEQLATKSLVKAGDIVFAVLDTAVNSDQPGPVMATVVSEPLKGARLLGTLTQTPDGERVTLTFTLMSKSDWASNISVNAVAINPDTARTALASDVDHHYILRWGSLFASNFLAGYSSAISTSGSTTMSSAGTTTTTMQALNPKDKVFVAFGKVGQAVSDVSGKWINRLPTVKVDAGVGIGLLFMADVPPPSFLPVNE